MNKREIKALIDLLDDPDEGIFTHIKDKFVSFGPPVIPYLETAWENTFEMLIQKRIEQIIHTIQFENLIEALKEWKENQHEDLLSGILLVSRYQYPDLDEDKIKKQIQSLIQDVWLEINDELTALEKVKIINHVLFDIHQFSGNITNYHAPQNSFINTVLETKKGNPVSISILYLLIARELKIPIYGVNLPEHFILGYLDESAGLTSFDSDEIENCSVLFYINAFSRGIVFSKEEIDQFLKQLNLEPKPIFYQPCNHVSILARVIRNLIYSFEKLGHSEKVEELNRLLFILAPF